MNIPFKQNFECKIAINFLPISLSICFGRSKEASLLCTYKICFG